jgi:RNA polymerase sigma-70 factor (ECF subfamily)
VQRRERIDELYAALGGLEEREQEIISLKFGGGMSNQDIADVLSLSETNVGTILCRSLNKLNPQLEDGMNND